ncbi:hypothetical protein EO95_12785 [Methanosarcina sp. 1.H.T.1A.1]|nr:hypothetical protein EO95_12785 [Methanosarcina sp. 1.H.T.1A.1]
MLKNSLNDILLTEMLFLQRYRSYRDIVLIGGYFVKRILLVGTDKRLNYMEYFILTYLRKNSIKYPDKFSIASKFPLYITFLNIICKI